MSTTRSEDNTKGFVRERWGNILLFLLIIIILFSCKPEKERYYLLHKYDSMDVGLGERTFVYKSKEKWNYDTILIYSDVLKYKENRSYIIVLQKPNKNLILKDIESSLKILKDHYEDDSVVIFFPHSYSTIEMNKKYKREIKSLQQFTEDSINSYKTVALDIFNNEKYYQKVFKNRINYFIIDKDSDSVFGPLSKSDFNNIKDSKGIKLTF